MRLIDADYLKEALGIFNDVNNGDPHFLNGIETAREIIDNAPTIDAVIRKRESRKMLPCMCGYNKREYVYDSNGVVYLVCKRCGLIVCGKDKMDAVSNWNKAVSGNETD